MNNKNLYKQTSNFNATSHQTDNCLIDYCSTNDYPVFKVIICYAIFGGTSGGAIIGLFFGLFFLFGDFSPALILLPLLCACFGFVIGFIPALITGIILALKKAQEGSMLVPIVGGIISALCAFTFFIFDKKSMTFDISTFLITLAITVIGMLSAIAVGAFVLPNKKDIEIP